MLIVPSETARTCSTIGVTQPNHDSEMADEDQVSAVGDDPEERKDVDEAGDAVDLTSHTSGDDDRHLDRVNDPNVSEKTETCTAEAC